MRPGESPKLWILRISLTHQKNIDLEIRCYLQSQIFPEEHRRKMIIKNQNLQLPFSSVVALGVHTIIDEILNGHKMKDGESLKWFKQWINVESLKYRWRIQQKFFWRIYYIFIHRFISKVQSQLEVLIGAYPLLVCIHCSLHSAYTHSKRSYI